MLLDEQHTDSRLSNDPLHRRLDVLNDVRLNPLGGLIEQQQLGLAEQGPGDRQLLLLTTTEVTAFAGQKLLQNGEEFVDEGIDAPVAGESSWQSLHPEHQVLFHRQLGNDFPTLGDVTHTGASPLVRSLAIQGIGVEDDLAATGTQQTDQGLEQGGLAHAVPADQAHHLPRIHGEVHVPKDVALAVIGVQAADLKQRRHPFSSSVVPR